MMLTFVVLFLTDTATGQRMSDLQSSMVALEKTVSKVLMLFDSVGHLGRPADGRP